MDINLRKNKFSGVPTITELRNQNQQMKDSEYRIPTHEISIWEENGWNISDCGQFMTKGKNKKVFVKQ